MRRGLVQMVVAACLLPCAAAAESSTRAWLDRDRIALGETTTLNIQTDQASATAPDYAPLQIQFDVSANSSSRQYELVNGVASQHVLFAVALRPRREGLLAIPPLQVGNERTQALTLTVSAQAAAPARADGTVFIDSEADAQDPYIQQAVGYTVRLYYATPLVSGQLDQDPPTGATLQRVGEDAQYAREVGGRTYTVVERHYLLIPERSGTLTIPGARFEGKAAGGFFDDLLGDGEQDLHATSAPRVIRVRPAPASAPQPWLPLRSLALRYLDTPQTMRAGEAASVTIELSADGASASQLPELQMSGDGGAQVFADAPQSDDSFSDGRPQVRLTRKFSVVASQDGTVRVRGPRVQWWDVRAGMARTASLPDLVLHVAPAAGARSAISGPASFAPGSRLTDEEGVRVPGVQRPVRPWALATAVFAVLWLVTLGWALQRRSATVPPETGPDAVRGKDAMSTRADLRRALEQGDLGDVAEVLCTMCIPPAADLDVLCARLADPRQVAAVQALQRARWGGGDGVAARAALRAAFGSGVSCRKEPTRGSDEPLAPLYPD
ncbi:MAG: BatD family protein [Luteimonas sp.]